MAEDAGRDAAFYIKTFCVLRVRISLAPGRKCTLGDSSAFLRWYNPSKIVASGCPGRRTTGAHS